MVKASSTVRRALAALLAVCLGLSIAGCGFQLRGQADLPFDSVYVQSAGSSQLATELRRVFEGNNSVVLADSAEHAEVVIRIVEEQEEQKILSISASGSVNEFQLLYRVSYRIMNPGMEDMVAPGEIRVQRDLTYDDTQTLGKESEIKLLFREMRSDAVQQMLRRLSVVSASA
jgi:LPS-assembly lipoprotein